MVKAVKKSKKKATKKLPVNGKAQNRISAITPREPVMVEMDELNIGKFKVTIRGTAPLVCHNFGDKARRQMLEAQMKTEKIEREPRCPEEEFIDACYWLKGDKPEPKKTTKGKAKEYNPKVIQAALKNAVFGVPAPGIKNAIISACRNTGGKMKMTNAKQAIQSVQGNFEDDPSFCVIKSPTIPVMDARICRLSGPGKVPIERFRPRWNKWETSFTITFDMNVLSQKNVVNLIGIAGAFVGLCEGRPEKCAIGWGTFEVV